MSENRTVDRQIAVFGQSGSGKTVLLSSFYGTAQNGEAGEPQLFELRAKEDRHNILMQIYLGMKEDSKAPAADRFDSKKTVFSLKQKGIRLNEAAKASEVRLTWFDYPGEWFEGSATTDSERQDKARTFRNLLGADVALFLVDGQKLHDHAGEEERYLRYLFSGFIESLNQVKDEILADGKQLKQFPRNWVIALSKADLWPELSVQEFENLLNKKAASDIIALRSKLLEFIEHDEAFSFGKDFLLLSSAKFTPGHIDISQRKGIDVLLPLACVLPVQRKLRWQNLKVLPADLAMRIGTNDLVQLVVPLVSKVLGSQRINNRGVAVAAMAFSALVEHLADQPKESLQGLRDEAVQKREFLKALVAEFTRKLDQAVDDRVLVRDL